jgi:peptidoglycan-associated lipoprotein
MKFARTLALLCVCGGLAACGTAERPVARQVMIIAPPADAPPSAPVTAAAPAPAASPAALEPPPAVAIPAPEPATPSAPTPPAPVPARADTAAPSGVDVIYFKPDAYKFDEPYRAMLLAHAKRLKASPGLRMVIQAYADRRGASDYNLALSKKRAETVAKFLIAQGVPAEQLELVSRGGSRRAAHSERMAAADRRVELQYRLR